MADKIQLRRDTAANWTSANTILAQGEVGFELDTYKFKIGDGTTAWTSLAYFEYTHPNHSGEVTSTGDGATVVASVAVTNKTLVTAAVGDHVLVADTSDAGNLKKVTVQTIVDLATDTTDHTALSNIGVNAHSVIDTHLGDATKHRIINDAGTTTTELWSADKLTTELSGKSATGHSHVATDVTDFDTEVSNNTSVAANTSKATNATHTGEVTGSGVLTVDKTSISNKTLVVAAAGDHVLVGDVSDIDNLKKVTVQTIVDLAAGSYTHPNHSGEVTSTGDGAQVIDKTAITNKTLVTAVGTDHFLIADASDTDNLKKVLVSDVLGGGTDADAIHKSTGAEISTITEKTVPIAADLLIIEDSAAANVKKKVQIGNLLGAKEIDELSDGKTASTSVCLGTNAGLAGVGIFNTVVGEDAYTADTAGSKNTVMGWSASKLSETGGMNTAIGSQSLSSNIAGDNNTAIGQGALFATTGDENTAVGSSALGGIVGGTGNVGVGRSALNKNVTGSDTTTVGTFSGLYYGPTGFNFNVPGDDGILIGANIRAGANGATNEIIIGTNAVGNGSNTTTIGNASTTDTFLAGNVDMATVKITGGVPGAAKVLTSDADGDATWEVIPTHTGDVTGATALTVDKTAISGKTLVTAAVGDHVLVGDASDTDNLKKVTVQTIVDLATGYTHPNHTGEVTSTGDGAQVLDKTSITNKTLVTALGTDHVLIADASDTGNLKKVLVSDMLGAGTDNNAIHDNVASEISAITEKTTPVSGDFLIIEDSAAANVKKRIQVGNLPSGGGAATFTEAWDVITTDSSGAWVSRTLTGHADEIVQVIVDNGANATRTVGVRAKSSSIARTIAVAKGSAVTFLVQADASADIEIYGSGTSIVFHNSGSFA